MRLMGLKTIKCASTPEINLIYIRYENFNFFFTNHSKMHAVSYIETHICCYQVNLVRSYRYRYIFKSETFFLLVRTLHQHVKSIFELPRQSLICKQLP